MTSETSEARKGGRGKRATFLMVTNPISVHLRNTTCTIITAKKMKLNTRINDLTYNCIWSNNYSKTQRLTTNYEVKSILLHQDLINSLLLVVLLLLVP